MDTPPLTPQTAYESIDNTDYFNKDNCLFIDTTITTTTSSSNSSSGCFGGDLFGPIPPNATTTNTTNQGFFPPISELSEGDYFSTPLTTTTTNNNTDSRLQDLSIMSDDDIFAEMNDTLSINDNSQSSTYPIITDDFTLF